MAAHQDHRLRLALAVAALDARDVIYRNLKTYSMSLRLSKAVVTAAEQEVRVPAALEIVTGTN